MKVTKGIILAGGTGSRLYPLTIAANKQLFPLYNKPVLYYPLSLLMLAGIRDVLIISTEKDRSTIQELLGDGERLGIHCSYAIQKAPRGLPDAFIVGETFLQNEPCMLVLGDNFLYGADLSNVLQTAIQQASGAHLFVHHVDDPSAYGIMTVDAHGSIQSIVEKPKNPQSNLGIIGLYIFDGNATAYAKQLYPSQRNELEIVDLIKKYQSNDTISYSQFGRGFTWYDTGNPDDLLEVGNFVRTIETRQGLLVASPEEIALRQHFISVQQFERQVADMPNGVYKKTLIKFFNETNASNTH